jgi:hypothetical protein
MEKSPYICRVSNNKQTKKHTMDSVRCIKEVTTKKGLTFKKDEIYACVISNCSIRIYFNETESLVIKNRNTQIKYFK